jgi:hypothetical protein
MKCIAKNLAYPRPTDDASCRTREEVANTQLIERAAGSISASVSEAAAQELQPACVARNGSQAEPPHPRVFRPRAQAQR